MKSKSNYPQFKPAATIHQGWIKIKSVFRVLGICITFRIYICLKILCKIFAWNVFVDQYCKEKQARFKEGFVVSPSRFHFRCMRKHFVVCIVHTLEVQQGWLQQIHSFQVSSLLSLLTFAWWHSGWVFGFGWWVVGQIPDGELFKDHDT